MNKVIFPLKPRMQGTEVVNLQDALKLMLEREKIHPNDPHARTALLAKLPSERQTQTYGNTTKKTVMAFQEGQQLQPDGVVGQQTAAAINMLLKEWGVFDQPSEEEVKYQVQGQIMLANYANAIHPVETPLAGALIRAFDKDLRHEQLLGEINTDRQGRYIITYTQAQFRRAEKQNADLILRVIGPDGIVLATSVVIFNAQPSEVIDLVIPGPPAPEYQQLIAEVTPLLEGLSFAELTEQDISFLANETSIERLFISILISAAKLASLTGLAINVHYGMLREGLPSELSLLLKQGRDKQRSALEDAMKKKLIATLSSEELEEILDRLEKI